MNFKSLKFQSWCIYASFTYKTFKNKRIKSLSWITFLRYIWEASLILFLKGQGSNPVPPLIKIQSQCINYSFTNQTLINRHIKSLSEITFLRFWSGAKFNCISLGLSRNSSSNWIKSGKTTIFFFLIRDAELTMLILIQKVAIKNILI